MQRKISSNIEPALWELTKIMNARFNCTTSELLRIALISLYAGTFSGAYDRMLATMYPDSETYNNVKEERIKKDGKNKIEESV